MLTTKRLIELGFKIIKIDNDWYLKKGVICLFPMNGCWAFGKNIDNLAQAPKGQIYLVSNEDELLSFYKTNKIEL